MPASSILERLRGLLARTAPFDLLDPDQYQALLTDLSVEFFEPGEVIIEQGSTAARGLFIVESGLVRLMDVEADRLLDKCGEGDVFGSLTLVKGGSSHYQARAVESTVCALLKNERFQQLYTTHDAFAAFFERDIKRYIRRAGTPQDVSGAYLLLGRRLAQYGYRAPIIVAPTLPAREAARLMDRHRTNALVVEQDDGTLAGLVTAHDLTTRLLAQGLPYETPVDQLMTAPAATISAEAMLLDAVLEMLHRRVQQLVIVREGGANAGAPVGLLTHQDVAHFRGLDPIATIAYIEQETHIDALVNVRAEMNEHLLHLYEQGVPPETLARIAAALSDRVVIRVLQLVEQEIAETLGHPLEGVPWVWLRMGSSARHEMALNSAQHNALLFADQEDEAANRQAEIWLDALAERANAALEACGFTPSAVVARDPRWRMPLSEWQDTYRRWIAEADADALADAIPFFDVRGVYGAPNLSRALLQSIHDALADENARRQLSKQLAVQALGNPPPLSFFRRLVLERSGEHRHRLDLRSRGILPVVDAARVLALDLRFLTSMNTFDRLRHAALALPELAPALHDVLDAYHYLVDFRLEHQLRGVNAGEAPDNYIDPARLNKAQQSVLRNAFAAVAALQKALAERYDTGTLFNL